MLGSVFYWALILVLLGITYQDYKFRGVSWYLFPLVLILFTLYYKPFHNLEIFLYSMIANLIFILFQFGFLILYFRAKKIGVKLLLKKYIGFGDILFFMVLAIILPFPFYPVFMVTSLIISALLGLIFYRKTSVPLAGIQSFCLVLCLIIDSNFKVNDYLLNFNLWS